MLQFVIYNYTLRYFKNQSYVLIDCVISIVLRRPQLYHMNLTTLFIWIEMNKKVSLNLVIAKLSPWMNTSQLFEIKKYQRVAKNLFLLLLPCIIIFNRNSYLRTRLPCRWTSLKLFLPSWSHGSSKVEYWVRSWSSSKHGCLNILFLTVVPSNLGSLKKLNKTIKNDVLVRFITKIVTKFSDRKKVNVDV